METRVDDSRQSVLNRKEDLTFCVQVGENEPAREANSREGRAKPGSQSHRGPEIMYQEGDGGWPVTRGARRFDEMTATLENAIGSGSMEDISDLNKVGLTVR